MENFKNSVSPQESQEKREKNKPLYSKEFFYLQSRFAEKISELKGISKEEAFLGYTTLANIVLGQEYNIDNEDVKRSLVRLRDAEDPAETMYQEYLKTEEKQKHEADEREYFGCFTYDYKDGEVRIHFKDRETDEDGPLSKENIKKRREELAVMLADIKEKHPNAKYFRTSTWLNNIPSYSGLFPEDIKSGLKKIGGRYHRMNLWGQFLKRDGSVRKKESQDFIKKIEEAKKVEDLKNIFPYEVLEGKCDIGDLYRMYKVA